VVVRLLLEAAPEAAEVADYSACLPLHQAAEEGHEAVVCLLLDSAPAAALAPEKGGILPLHQAAHGGRTAVVSMLLEAAPATASAIGGGATPLQVALATFHTATARMFLSAGTAAAVLAALAAAGEPAVCLFPAFVACPGRLPLSASNWPMGACALAPALSERSPQRWPAGRARLHRWFGACSLMLQRA